MDIKYNQKLIRLPAVIERTGLPRSTIYRKIAQNLFPQQIRISERSVGWLESEINDWIEYKVQFSKNETGSKYA